MTLQTVRINLLGPVEVVTDTRVIAFHGSKIPTLLAALTLAKGRPVHDSRISLYLWGSSPPATQAAQLYTYASRLRNQLGECIPIIRHASGYQLDAETVEVDAHRFRRLAQQGNDFLDRDEPASAARVIEEALALWRGPAMMGITEHLQSAGIALDELRLDAIEARSEALLMLDQHRQLTFELSTLVAENPGRERLRAQLMIALYRGDRQSEALELYHAGRHELADGMGVDPGHYLTSAYMGVLEGMSLTASGKGDQTSPRAVAASR
jgi:SARP family transcriptional regulator, regulator of embCAB operon